MTSCTAMAFGKAAICTSPPLDDIETRAAPATSTTPYAINPTSAVNPPAFEQAYAKGPAAHQSIARSCPGSSSAVNPGAPAALRS
eukprot:1182902-Prorocentrum_minimum.AAC.4